MTRVNTTVRVEAEVEARRKRAAEALASGKYRVTRVQKGQWRVENGETAYTVSVVDGRVVCDCPDFRNRGDVIGTCKHIEMVRLHVKKPARSTNGKEASTAPEAAPAAPEPQEQPEAQAAPTGEGLDPGSLVIPWGKRKGQRLSEVEDPEYIFWVARKMEPRTEADRALQEAARTLLADLVAEAVERAFADESAMPVLPFGEEKGKPIHRAHPKWVAILAKKGPEDARSFQDLVLYEVARRLQAQRQQERRKKASASALDTQVFLGAIRVIILETIREAIPAALEAARQQEADQDAVLTDLADLRRRVEALEKAVRAAGALATREALLAAR